MTEQNARVTPVSDPLLDNANNAEGLPALSENGLVPGASAPLAPELATYIETLVTRRVQGERDKRYAQLEKQYHALLERVAVPAIDNALAPLPEAALDAAVQPAALQSQPAAQVSEPNSSATDPTVAALLTVLGQLSAQLAGSPQQAGGVNPAGALLPPPNASTIIQPTGGLPRPALNTDYARRRADLRPGDVHGLMALKREFRAKGLEIF